MYDFIAVRRSDRLVVIEQYNIKLDQLLRNAGQVALAVTQGAGEIEMAVRAHDSEAKRAKREHLSAV